MKKFVTTELPIPITLTGQLGCSESRESRARISASWNGPRKPISPVPLASTPEEWKESILAIRGMLSSMPPGACYEWGELLANADGSHKWDVHRWVKLPSGEWERKK